LRKVVRQQTREAGEHPQRGRPRPPALVDRLTCRARTRGESLNSPACSGSSTTSVTPPAARTVSTRSAVATGRLMPFGAYTMRADLVAHVSRNRRSMAASQPLHVRPAPHVSVSPSWASAAILTAVAVASVRKRKSISSHRGARPSPSLRRDDADVSSQLMKYRPRPVTPAAPSSGGRLEGTLAACARAGAGARAHRNRSPGSRPTGTPNANGPTRFAQPSGLASGRPSRWPGRSCLPRSARGGSGGGHEDEAERAVPAAAAARRRRAKAAALKAPLRVPDFSGGGLERVAGASRLSVGPRYSRARRDPATSAGRGRAPSA